MAMASNIQEPWLILGDFNCIRKYEEELGGTSPISSKLVDFNNCIYNSGLLDVPHVGYAYNWFNQQTNKHIRCLIDKAFL